MHKFNSYEEVIVELEALFKKVTQDEVNEEEFYAPQFLELLNEQKRVLLRDKKSPNWQSIKMAMQKALPSFRSPLMMFDKKGMVYKHVRDLMIIFEMGDYEDVWSFE